jgi:MFS family permease
MRIRDLRRWDQSADSATTASAFFIAQVFTAPLYGAVSDRFGRKPVLLFGLLGSAVCTILYGVSSNLTMAIVSRALCGLFNGTNSHDLRP